MASVNEGSIQFGAKRPVKNSAKVVIWYYVVRMKDSVSIIVFVG